MLSELPTCQPSRKSLPAHIQATRQERGSKDGKQVLPIPTPSCCQKPAYSCWDSLRIYFMFSTNIKSQNQGFAECLKQKPPLPSIFKTCFTLQHHLLEHRLQGTSTSHSTFSEMGGEEGRLQCLPPVQSAFV